jgi:poly(3-hydroxybutyrate) depolymerase
MFGATALAARIEKLTLTSRGKERTYYLFVPEGVTRDHPVPLVITLHGSGRNGASLVEKWKDLAAKEGIILAGPDSTDSKQWSYPEDGPMLLRDVVEAVKTKYPVDGRRVYLFGHSAGAGFAIQMGLLESEYFAAVAIHAGALSPNDYPVMDIATRKLPFAIFVGTIDPYFPLAQVRATRDALQKSGFVAELTEIPRHNHDYYSIADRVNRPAWDFLGKYSLPQDAKFTSYANM